MRSHFSFAVLCVASLLASGCAREAFEPAAAAVQAHTLQGSVHGGQQPISGATVKMYHINVSTEKGSAVQMLTGTTTTGSDGSFSITGKYTCGTSTYVYMVVTGGQPIPGTTNTNTTLMSALGLCSSLTTSTFISINEVTTVATIAALAPYMASPTAIGTSSSAGEMNNLADQFALATQLVNTATGMAPGLNVPANMSVPQALLNTLGNIMAACVNSGGGTAGDPNACGSLFTLTTLPGGTAPTDTATAMLNLLNHPTLNTSDLFNLITPDAPFAPSLSSAPATYDVALIPPAFTVTRSLITLPDDGLSQIYALINNAQTSIDMTIYELKDTTASGDLVAACNRGVKVRVILDQSVQSTNLTAYNQLNAVTNCTAVWSNPQFNSTHQKSILFDGSELALMSANLTSQYYANGRDFILLTNDPIDIAAVEDTFTQDYGSTTDHYYSTHPGNDLLWSPTSAQTGLLQIINGATSTVTVENEEMSATNIITALSNAVTRGVTCNVIMTDGGSYGTQLTTLKNAGCNVRTYVDHTGVLYIHAKVILADYGTAAQVGYMGSINFSTMSMLNNRELGTVLTDATILSGLNAAVTSDFNGGTAY